MGLQANPQVFVVGQGPLAEQLEMSFKTLGCVTTTGALSEAHRATPDLIVNSTTEIDPDELRQVAKETKAWTVPSFHACEITQNRRSIRLTAAEELGLPTMFYEFANTFEELRTRAGAVGYPCVVKPSISSGGKGQSVVSEPDQLAHAWRQAREITPDGDVVVERYVDFDYEVTIVAARALDPVTGQLATWFCEPIGTRHENGHLVESWQPAPLSEAAMDNARSIAARISGKIGGQGVYSIELFVAGDDVYFSDVNPRPSLDGILTRATQRVNVFDLHARAVSSLPIDVTLVTPGANRIIDADAMDSSGLFRALAVEETSVHVLGDVVAVQSTGETVEEARERANRAADQLSAQE